MFEKVIIQNIFKNTKFGAEYLEFLSSEYFELIESRYIFKEIVKYFNEYTKIPSISEVSIELSQNTNIRQEDFSSCVTYIDELENNDVYHIDYIVNSTQKWIKDKAFENSIVEAIAKREKGEDISYIAEKIREGFSISFNQTIGNSFWRDTQKQRDYYKHKENKFPCNITELNKVCGGGVERKTINLLMGGTGTGKTTTLCSLASSYLRRGQNVLYITMEMAEEKIRQRIEANFFKVAINDIPDLSDEMYFKKMSMWGKASSSNLYIKEYPTAMCSVNNIRTLLDNLETKEGFIPDIVMIDYIGIMRSVRLKSNENSYSYHKTIAEEVRGLMIEKNLVCWSAIQSNRDGNGKSDLQLNNSAESFGTPMTADLQIGLIETKELKATNNQIWKCLKTRYSNLKDYKFKVLVQHEFGSVSDDAESQGTIETEEESNDILENTVTNKMKSMSIDNKKKMKGLELNFD